MQKLYHHNLIDNIRFPHKKTTLY